MASSTKPSIIREGQGVDANRSRVIVKKRCAGKPICGTKRAPKEMIDRNRGGKKCFLVLEKLMRHPYGQELSADRVKTEEEKRRIMERQEAEEKMQRCQREREAARTALEKMEKAVEFEDNISILTDLAYIMRDFTFAGPLGGSGGMYAPSNRFVNGKLKSPLESFGLYLKDEYDV